MDATDPLWSELRGRYRPERPLGAGGMAEVWLVHDERHGRLVALKLLGEHLASAMGQDRFKREIALLARLQHPNVLPLIDSGENAGRMWYVTPFIEGESLRDRIEREGKLDITEALRLGSELLDALGYAHRSGVVHRDIKPENVLLSQGHALLADFGIAREEGKDRLTATGLSVGTPSYMSPEQVAGEGAGALSDLYSLGCVLFECLTGQPPFVGPDARAVMAQHVMDPAPSLRARRPNVPEGVERVVLRALEKDPKDRWPDAAAFARALSEPTTSKTSLVGSEIRRARPRARRRLLVAAGVVVAIAVAAGGVALWQSRGKLAVGPKVTLRQVTFRGDVCRSEISPDGRYVAYYAGRQVWLTDLERDRTWAVGDYVFVDNCNWLGWTADGSGIAWELHDSTYVAGTSGEMARAIGTRGLVRDSVWSRGGWAIRNFDTGPGDRMNRVSLRQLGHSATRVVPSAVVPYGNLLSPDGSRAIMQVQGRWALVDVTSGRVAPLDSGAAIRFPVAWSADSRAVYVYSDSVPGLLRLELDRDRLRLGGRRTQLLPGLDSRSYVRSAAVWRNRVVIDRTRESRSLLVGRLSTVGGRPRFSVEELAPGSLVPTSAAFAPRHNRLYFIAEADSADGLFEMALPGGAPHRVARLRNGGFDLRLSPDGSAAVVGSRDGQRLKATLVDLSTDFRGRLSGQVPAWSRHRGPPRAGATSEERRSSAEGGDVAHTLH